MSTQCPNVPETIPVAINGIVQSQTIAQFSAQFAGQFKTPTADFSSHVNGHTLSFKKNVPFLTDAKLLSALTAQSAPIV